MWVGVRLCSGLRIRLEVHHLREACKRPKGLGAAGGHFAAVAPSTAPGRLYAIGGLCNGNVRGGPAHTHRSAGGHAGQAAEKLDTLLPLDIVFRSKDLPPILSGFGYATFLSPAA